MSSDNPYEASEASTPADERTASEPQENQETVSSGRAAYNVVTDTVTGVNFRGSDNKFQAKFIGLTILILSAVGAIACAAMPQWRTPWWGGAIVGVLVGLVVGLLLSGIILMIFRAYRHMQGRHD